MIYRYIYIFYDLKGTEFDNSKWYDRWFYVPMCLGFEGNKAIVVAITLPGSENSIQQALELNKTLDTRSDEIAVIQVVAGMDARTSDAASLKQRLNVSWPILLDEDSVKETKAQ